MSMLAHARHALWTRLDGFVRAGLVTAWAHADDALLQMIYVTPRAAGVGIEVQLIPGAIVTPEFMALLDADGDGVISKAEADAHLEAFLATLDVRFEGMSVPTRVSEVRYPDAELLAAGGGTITFMLEADAPTSEAAVQAVTVTDGYAPLHTVVQYSVTLQADAPAMVHEIERSEDGTSVSVRYHMLALAFD